MSRRSLILGIAIFLNCVLVAALIMRAKPMYPLPRGTSAEFWDVSTETGIACIEGDYAYYSPTMMESECVFWVPKSEAMRDFPAVLSKLEKESAAAGDSSAGGYQRWKKLPSAQQDVSTLLLFLQDQATRRVLAKADASPGASSLFADMHAWMLSQIQKADHYWANVVFELLYLGGLICFAFWPFIWSRSVTRRATHLALSPCLLLLPAWLGYCGVTVQSLGPAGGIIYSDITFALRLLPPFQPQWNFAFQQAMPSLLDTLNQSPAWNLAGAPPGTLAFTGVGLVPGPLDAAVYGISLAVVYLTICLLAFLYRRRRILRPGFEVILDPASSEISVAPPNRGSSNRG